MAMRGRRIGGFAAVAMVAWLAGFGCDREITVETACSRVCECAFGLPSQQDDCTDQCIAIVEPVGIPANCGDCVVQQSCELIADGACDPFCNMEISDAILDD